MLFYLECLKQFFFQIFERYCIWVMKLYLKRFHNLNWKIFDFLCPQAENRFFPKIFKLKQRSNIGKTRVTVEKVLNLKICLLRGGLLENKSSLNKNYFQKNLWNWTESFINFVSGSMWRLTIQILRNWCQNFTCQKIRFE